MSTESSLFLSNGVRKGFLNIVDSLGHDFHFRVTFDPGRGRVRVKAIDARSRDQTASRLLSKIQDLNHLLQQRASCFQLSLKIEDREFNDAHSPLLSISFSNRCSSIVIRPFKHFLLPTYPQNNGCLSDADTSPNARPLDTPESVYIANSIDACIITSLFQRNRYPNGQLVCVAMAHDAP